MIAIGTRGIRDRNKPADTMDSWRSIRRQLGRAGRTIANSDTTFIAAVNGPVYLRGQHLNAAAALAKGLVEECTRTPTCSKRPAADATASR